MDFAEFLARSRSILDAFRAHLPEGVGDDVGLYLDTGEEGLAIENLVGALLLGSVGVTTAQALEIRRLMEHVAVDPRDEESRRYYPLLADPHGSAAELVIIERGSAVDGASS